MKRILFARLGFVALSTMFINCASIQQLKKPDDILSGLSNMGYQPLNRSQDIGTSKDTVRLEDAPAAKNQSIPLRILSSNNRDTLIGSIAFRYTRIDNDTLMNPISLHYFPTQNTTADETGLVVSFMKLAAPGWNNAIDWFARELLRASMKSATRAIYMLGENQGSEKTTISDTSFTKYKQYNICAVFNDLGTTRKGSIEIIVDKWPNR